MTRPLAKALVGLALAAAAACWPAPAAAEPGPAPSRWRELMPGLEFARLPAPASARAGSEHIAVLRVDPRRLSFRVLAGPPGQEGRTAEAWREKTGALAVFNAGQYAADRTYLGLLVADGRARGRLASRLEGLFVAEPHDPALPQARVMDLRYTAFDLRTNPYRQVAQSLMLLDRFGHIRVRRSPLVAHRTAVAEDAAGRILVMVTEGGHTLWELADFLKSSPLELREVMSMDGASESQLAVRVGGFSYLQHGEPTGSPQLPLPWPSSPLPVALGIFPR